MRWLKLVTIILIIVIVASTTATVILTSTYGSNKGSIEETGFIIQELDGAGDVRYDLDDDGNIYFAETTLGIDGIVIYNNKGNYMYTLPIQTMGALGVRIDDDNNILVYVIRKDSIFKYNNKGIEINIIDDSDYSLRKEFFWPDNPNVKERNGIRYVNINGTITKEENGVKTVVFTIPVWQKWNRAFSLILILSIIALFLRIFVPLWIKAFKDRNSNLLRSVRILYKDNILLI